MTSAETSIESFAGLRCGADLMVYVDDPILVAKPVEVLKLWKEIGD